MINNYLRVAVRSFSKGISTSLVNICGLAVAISGALLIGVFVSDELQYDQHFENKERIYRLTTRFESNGTARHSAQTTANIASLLREQLPSIEQVARLLRTDEAFLFAQQRAFKENIIYTDSSFADIFGLELIMGSKAKCLSGPSSIIISESTAIKLFGRDWRAQELLGTTLSVDNKIPLTLTGIFRDLPIHTHFNARLFASLPSGLEEWMSDDSRVYTYVLLREHADPDVFHRMLGSQSFAATPVADRRRERIDAQALADIHLSPALEDDNAILGNRKNIYALSVAALVLVFIAITNFANLYTASALNRFKEVGIRKTMGAVSSQVRFQFWSETLLITVVAGAVAVIATTGFLPLFNELTGKNFSFESFVSIEVIVLMFALIIVISFSVSAYPAVMLSRIRTIHALKGNKVKVTSVNGMKKLLIVLQFSISAIAIVLSIVAFRQMSFINNKSLGFDKEHTVALANPYMLGSTDAIIGFKHELMSVPGIDQVSITGYTPSQTRWANHKMTFPDGNPASSYASVANWIMVDHDFIATMGLTLLAGRTFHENYQRDQNSIIVNQKAVTEFGLSEAGKSPLGTRLSVKWNGANEYENYTVVGVIEDFNFGSMHESIEPIVMKAGIHRFEMILRLSASYPKQDVLQKVGSIWKRNLPMIPFEYAFVKDRFDRLHRSDTNAGKFFLVLCVVTIVISAVGIFSLAAYTVRTRTKEIGIRMVVGASARSIVMLISRDFIILLFASVLLAWPFSMFLTNQWLSDFAYRVQVPWSVYGIAALTLLLVGALTVAYQLKKAAAINPVDNLKSE